MDAAEDFEGIAQRMKPIDRLIFTALCEGANPFTKETMAKVDREAEVKGVPSNNSVPSNASQKSASSARSKKAATT